MPHEAVDLGFRTAYRVAHRMLRTYWKFRRPRTHGSLIALWYEGELLVVKNSYRAQYTLPGGYVRRGESAQEAGARELFEEVALKVSAEQMKLVYSEMKPFENRSDCVSIVEFEAEAAPQLTVDNREVVWAGFRSADQVLGLPIVPHLRDYLRARQSGNAKT